MGRFSFPPGAQKSWINSVLRSGELQVDDLAFLCGVCSRTIRDWRREKFTIPQDTADRLSKKFQIRLPHGTKLLDDFWYCHKGARKGGLRSLELYGPPGNLAGRIKGGQVSQQRRKAYPERYQNCNLTKVFSFPKKSIELSELVGILLGDGGITHDQMRVYLGYEADTDYSYFVSDLIKHLFYETPKVCFSKSKEKIDVRILQITGVSLVAFLIKIGLGTGNKVTRQAEVPKWVKENLGYSIACLRGLIDTDGGVYFHHHKTGGHEYFNVGLTFTNRSFPLVKFAYETLKQTGFNPKLKPSGIYLYREAEVLKYAQEISFHNKHHLERLNQYLKEKTRKDARVV